MDYIVINGDEGEGGGQVLRTSLTLSSITKKPFHLKKIRGKRKKPGLKKQHLTCVKSAAQITSAKVTGDHFNSMEITFEPNETKAGKYFFDLQGAGSTMLVAQTILPLLAYAPEPSTLTLRGGTHNGMAPPFDFVTETLLPWIAPLGFQMELELNKYGFFPKGGGKITAKVYPFDASKKTAPLKILERGEDVSLKVLILHSEQSERVLEEEKELLTQQLDLEESQLEIKEVKSNGPGNVIILKAYYERGSQMFTSFCPRENSPKEWVDEVLEPFFKIRDTKLLVEEYLSDQLMLYMALKKEGRFYTPGPLSLHATTNMEIIEKFLPVKFSTKEPTTNCIEISVKALD